MYLKSKLQRCLYVNFYQSYENVRTGSTQQAAPLPDPLRWRHNEHDRVSNHQPHDCLLNGLFRRRSTKTSKLRVTGLCAMNSPETGEFPAQMASKAENASIWWRHHEWCMKLWPGSCSRHIHLMSTTEVVEILTAINASWVHDCIQMHPDQIITLKV